MKTLEEFIDDKVEHFGDDMGSDAIYTQRVINETAAEILRVAHDCSFDAYTNEGQKIRVVMLEDLESYIQPAKKESERL